MLFQIPYVATTAVFFTIPFFYIIGFDLKGDGTSKFFWYWLFHGLYSGITVSFGQFFAAVVPSEEVATVLVGLSSMMLSLFCGFMIKTQDFPRFWLVSATQTHKLSLF
jgi:ABC-type multidrug transport system permease subunit